MNKTFLVSELFEVKTTKSIDKNKIIFASNGKYDFIGRSSVNNGIQGKVNRLDYEPNPRNTFSLVQVGESVCLFRENEWYASQNIFILIPKIEELCLVPMYIIATVNAYLSVLFGSAYTYPKLTDVKGIPMQLPVVEHADPNHEYTVDDIDWQYMEDRIKELEEDRIKELDAYLKATNLNDYELTDEDKKVLSISRKSASNENGSLETDCENGTLRFKKFKVVDIFEVKNTKCFMKNDLILNSGNTPYITASDRNNSVMSYIACSEEQLDKGHCIFIGGKTLTFSYQDQDFVSNDSHNLVLYPKYLKIFSKYVYMYMIDSLQKSLKSKYYWGDSISNRKIQKDTFTLPVTPDGEPDFDYMERYIRAIEKLTIADVVKYKDKVIDTAKKLVNCQS
ncbi:restriction endonuclease subunit S [Gardnerella swidsinskii]|uniref:restriction endonuclease subunit S n=1 Tax=Gardnerella TaxID=2701 RepID=UPI00026347E1|nr:restriction endonuclease subunit S [Gardnerella vaginalis]EIK87687.1 putative R of type II restriction and modification system [Gardnerella vaginalis 6119V5]MBF9308998.1 restriction endonuclease subunit M [Bifidobacteriaceae bacterium NR043]MBF9353771.1 restriction endonuclease subunit M [Bifidobacteriaceae bacterium NR044]RFT39779.1 restriction endonuclease subunit M [Bifidobacteriaceae bacterium NR003]